MVQTSTTPVAKVQVAHAIAKVREAMSLVEEQEIENALNNGEPCDQRHAVEDASLRSALLTSEEAMISVLESLPATPGAAASLLN